MAQYSTYQSNAAEIPIMRKWLLRALVISLLIHAVLLIFFNFKKLENFGYTAGDQLAVPIFKLRQVKITEPAEPEPKPEAQVKKPLPPIAIEESKPIADEIQVKPSAPEMAPIVPEKPKQMDLSGFDAFDKNPGNSVAALEKQLGGLAGSIMDKSLKSPNQPKINIPTGGKKGDGGLDSAGGIPGRATLDQALSNAGAPIGNKAIAVQGGALFEWGKADLLPQAIQNLQKLGQLIRLNPKSTFIISGHTDHTGTHETNLILSQQRADSVRDWLVTNLGIDPMRITTIGKADDDAFPELGPDKSIEEQAPNRRVEIVIRTRGK
jgi:outer membrane protein OmpA-like peptidoglycan-associated protein